MSKAGWFLVLLGAFTLVWCVFWAALAWHLWDWDEED